MKKMLLCAGAFLACLATFAQDPMVLYFDQPANVFEEALPLGNGHLGAMVYGRIGDELIRLNEATLWSGSGADTDIIHPMPIGQIMPTFKAGPGIIGNFIPLIPIFIHDLIT